MAIELGELILSVRADAADLYQQMGQYRTDIAAFGQEAEAMLSGIKLKAVDLPTLTPTVDHEPLKALNAHIDQKIDHVKAANRFFQANPLKPMVDYSELKKLESLLSLSDGRSSISVKVSTDRASANKRDMGDRIVQGFQDSIRGVGKDFADNVGKAVKAATPKQGIFGKIGDGLLRGVGEEFGNQFTRNFQAQAKSIVGLDVDALSNSAIGKALSPVKFLQDNTEFQEVAKKAGGLIEDSLEKASFALGDGIVAALEARRKPIKDKVNAFIREGIDVEGFRNEISTLGADLKSLIPEARRSLLNGQTLEGPLSAFDELLYQRRMSGMQNRAIPLVQQRAAEILGSKRTKNTGKVVDDETRQLFIATGGFAQAKAANSGVRIAKNLNKELPDDAQAIWIKNPDSDLPASINGPAERLIALLTSLGKPNLRGFSKDAVEMASQAVAARETNPNVEIKLVGESGGGFVVEEAEQLLKMMGFDGVSSLSVGTPDLIGRVNRETQSKIISPDESLGQEVHRTYAPLGFSDINQPGQNILGVTSHPFEGYRDTQNPQLMNFLFGAPDPMSQEEINSIRTSIPEFQKQAEGTDHPKKRAELARHAMQNMNTLRRQALASAGDMAEELEELASQFEELFALMSYEDKGMTRARDILAHSQKVLMALQEQPGIEAAQIADQAIEELAQVRREFNEAYRDSVGTDRRKFDQISSQFDQLQQGFSDPGIRVKPFAPPQPEQPAALIPFEPEQKEMSLLDRGREAIAPAMNKAGELALEGVQKAGQAFGDAAENALVSRINQLLVRMPGEDNVIDVGRVPIQNVSDLTGQDLERLSQLGMQDLIKAAKALKNGIETTTNIVGPVALGAGKAVVGAIGERVDRPRQLEIETVRSNLGQIRGAVEKAQALIQGRPTQGQAFLESAENVLPQLMGEIEEAIKMLPSSDRMAPGRGSQLANAKSQLKKIEVQVLEIRELLEQNQTGDIFEADLLDSLDFRQVKQMRAANEVPALPAAAPLQSLNDYRQTIEAIGKELFEQSKAAQSLFKSGDLQKAQQIAREVVEAEQEVRDLLAKLKQGLTIPGERTDKKVSSAIGSTRGRVTRATKQAQNIIQQTEAAGVNVASAFNTGIESKISEAEQASEALGQASIDALRDVLEIRSPSRVGIYLGEMLGEGLKQGYESNSFNFIEEFKNLDSSIIDLGKSVFQTFASFSALAVIGDLTNDFVSGSLDAAINFERLENTFKFVTGLASAAADQIARIREEANTIGTDATLGLEGFAQLASATRGSSLEGAATEQLSTAIQQAAAVSQLDSESLDRANTAISQIAGKGKLSAEELRQQLAEVGGVFSGSFQIAARAIGVTTAELDKMLQRGEVLSEDFLPKFAQQLAAETAAGVAGAADTARASINRINNQMVELRESFGAPLVEARTSALNVGADLLEKLVDLAPIASSLLTGLISKLSIDAGSGLIQSLGGIQSLIGGGGPSFGDVDLDTGRGTTFGDRVVDGGLDLLTSDVTLLAESAKTKLSEAFMTAKTSVATASVEMSKSLALPTLSLESIKVSAISMAKTTTAQFTQISVASIRSAATMAKSMTVGFLNVSKAALAMGASLVKAIAPIIAISAAFESISVARRALALDDLAGEVGGFAEQAEQGFAAYQAAVAKATGANNEFIASLPGNRSDVGGDNLFTGSLVENLLGQGGAENLDKIFTRVVSLSGVGVASRALGRDGIRSVAERQAEQSAIARDELFQQANQTISASFESDVQSALVQVNDFDQQLGRLRSQRRGAVDPSEREAIGQSIEDLLQRREQQFGVVGSLQGELARERELIQKTIDDLQERATQAQPGISRETYERQLAVAESLLADIAERQDYLTSSIENSVDAAVLLTREFTALNAQFEDAQLALNIENAQGQLEAAIASQGMGQQAIEQITGQADIQRIRSQIELNTQKRDEIIALLNDQDIANAFEDFADRGITRDLGAAEILDRLEGEGDSTAVNNLRQFAENSIQLDQLQAETIQLDADLVNAQNNLQQQARDLAMQYRDLSIQISDFYRDALRSAEDVASQIVSQDFQNATQEISNEIRRELLGLEDSFVSGIGETFTGLIEAFRQPLLNELNAISERNNVSRQFEDALRSGQDLQRQADEFDFNAGFGGDPSQGIQAQALSQGGIAQIPGTAIRNGDIAAANALAQRSRQEQLASIDRNLATQADTAGVDAQTAIASIARQLEEGRRTIAEQSTSFTRSLRSIGEGIGDAKPLRELEVGLLAVSDQFEDTNRDLDRFKVSLDDTIAEASTVRQRLLEGVASGALGQDALAVLPDLDRTIAESQAALQRADGQIAENRQLLEAQRRELISDFEEAERDRRREAQRRIVEGRGAIDSARLERPGSSFSLGRQRSQELQRIRNEAEQQSISIAFEFDANTRELDDLLKTGELTKFEYAELRDNLIGLNEIRLDNLKKQFEDLRPTVDAIASVLGSATGEVNTEAFDQIQANIRTARQAGVLTDDQASEARAGLSEARQLSRRSDAGAIRGLVGTDNAFTSQFLSQAGRGDLTGLADLGIQNQQADRARRALSSINTDPQALANELTRPEFAQPNIDPAGAFAESSNKLVGALDRLTTAITENSGGGDVIIQRQNNTFSRDEESIDRKAKKLLEQALNSRI